MRRKPVGYRSLLSVEGDAKTVKGTKKGYLTAILYLAPSDMSGVANVCPKATKGCKASCLGKYAGRVTFTPNIWKARVEKTRFMVENREAFLASLRYDIESLIIKAKKRGLTPAVRLNGCSDLPQLAVMMAREFSTVQFYDYTKIPRPWSRMLNNYSVTFSHSEENLSDCLSALAHGVNVAVVFESAKSIPQTWQGHPVVNGDESDLRFLDARGVVVGLYAKGRAKQDCSGFVVRPDAQQLIQLH